MSEASVRKPDYERSDADPRLVAVLALGGAAFLVLAPYILLAIYPLARQEPPARITEPPPAPRLQIDPHADLTALRAAEERTAFELRLDRPAGRRRSAPDRPGDATDGRARPARMAETMSAVIGHRFEFIAAGCD